MIGLIAKNLCDSCTNTGCEFQSVRNQCDFYIPPRMEPGNCGLRSPNEVKAEDCISREYLRKSMIEYGWSHPDCTVTEYVESLPGAYPKSDKPSGKWINHIIEWECSECHYKVQGWNNTPYCPNCGCRMVEPQESEVEDGKDN